MEHAARGATLVYTAPMNTRSDQPDRSRDIYLRMSRDPGHDELGVQRQRRECESLCESRGWRIGVVHVDDDRSAYSGKPRPGYLELLRRLETGDTTGVIAWHPDRLHRSPKELEAFIDLVEATGAAVATVRAGDYDLTTPAGRMQARILGAIARHESEHKSERINLKMAELRADGKHTHGGRRPYGYTKLEKGTHHQELVDGEAAVIRELARRVLAGESLLSLTRMLNESGVPTVSGRPWALQTLSGILRSPRIAGLRVVDGQEVTAPWPAIISVRDHQEIAAMLAALLASQARRSGRHPRKYLLTGGLVICGGCGMPMVGRPFRTHRPEKADTYCCARERGGCAKVYARASYVDELVKAAVAEIVDGAALAALLRRLTVGNNDTALDSINRQQELIREIEDDRLEGRITRTEYLRLRDRAHAKLNDLRREYKPSTRTLALAHWQDQSLGDAWDGLSLGVKRTILDALGLRVHIAPRGRGASGVFDPSRVTMTWES
jgi:site-specific DNA recombinase